MCPSASTTYQIWSRSGNIEPPNALANALQHLVLVHQGTILGLQQEDRRVTLGLVCGEFLHLPTNLLAKPHRKGVVVWSGTAQENSRRPIALLLRNATKSGPWQFDFVNPSGEYRQPRTRMTYRIVNQKATNSGTPTASNIQSIIPPLSTPWLEGSPHDTQVSPSDPRTYLNGDSRSGPSTTLDSGRAPLIRLAFETVDSGKPLADALNLVTAAGLRTRAGKPLSAQSFWALLRNPIYAGRVEVTRWGIARDGDFEPIIAPSVFRRAVRRQGS